jgi:hypothetical protein
LGIYGFGAAAHIVAQVAQFERAASMHSHALAIRQPRPLRGGSGAYGPAAQRSNPRPSWTPPSSSRQLVRCCRPLWRACAKAAWSFSAAST